MRPVLLFMTFMLACPLFGQSVLVSHQIDWQARQIVFSLTTPVDQAKLPVSKQQAEALIASQKIEVLAQDIAGLALDSYGAFILPYNVVRPSLRWNLQTIAQLAQKKYAVFSEDLRSVVVTYTLNFADITKNLERLSQNYLQPYLGSSLPFDYTGIVVYGAEPLPVSGQTAVKKRLTPTLLPSLYSLDGRLLLSANTVKADFFQRWGTAGYSFSSKGSWPTERVGKNPLVVSAQQVYGNGQVDAMLADADANQILASRTGQNLLLEGRVVFVISPDPANVPN